MALAETQETYSYADIPICDVNEDEFNAEDSEPGQNSDVEESHEEFVLRMQVQESILKVLVVYVCVCACACIYIYIYIYIHTYIHVHKSI